MGWLGSSPEGDAPGRRPVYDHGAHRITTLQELFIESRGASVDLDGHNVCQAFRIRMNRGIVRLVFLSPPDSDQGVRLKARGGAIGLSDGTLTPILDIWNMACFPQTVEHRVACPNHEIVLWNVYRVHHPHGEVTEDYWTGDAGMVVLNEGPMSRRFGCSDWRSPFDPSRMVFEIEWCDEL